MTKDVPKCLTEIDGVPVLEHQVACLCRWGFKKLIVVVGHLEGSIRNFLHGLGAGIHIEHVSNPRFKTTNNNYSLWLARARLSEAFLLLECDLVFEGLLIEGLLHPNAMAVSPMRPWMSGTTVDLDGLHGIKRFEVAGSAGTGGLSHKTVNICSPSAEAWPLVEEGRYGKVTSGRLEGIDARAVPDALHDPESHEVGHCDQHGQRRAGRGLDNILDRMAHRRGLHSLLRLLLLRGRCSAAPGPDDRRTAP